MILVVSQYVRDWGGVRQVCSCVCTLCCRHADPLVFFGLISHQRGLFWVHWVHILTISCGPWRRLCKCHVGLVCSTLVLLILSVMQWQGVVPGQNSVTVEEVRVEQHGQSLHRTSNPEHRPADGRVAAARTHDMLLEHGLRPHTQHRDGRQAQRDRVPRHLHGSGPGGSCEEAAYPLHVSGLVKFVIISYYCRSCDKI